MRKKRIKRRQGQEGFTLVELMIAAGITLTAIVLAMGALVNIADTTKRSADKASARMNLSSISESIRNMTLNELVDFQAANQGSLGAQESILLQCTLTDGRIIDIPLTEEGLQETDFPNPLQVDVTVTWTDANGRVNTQQATMMVRRP